MSPVRLDRAHREEELLGDLLVRVTQGQEPQHLPLPVGERILLGPSLLLGLGGDEAGAERGVDVLPAGRHFADRADHLRVHGLF